MSKRWSRRTSRRRLKAHERGDDRHNKGVQFNNKKARLDLKKRRTK